MEISKRENKNIKVYFLGTVVLVYLIVAFLNFDLVVESLIFFLDLFKEIFPIFFLVFLISFVLNFFISQKQVNEYIGKSSGYKKWLVAVISGIFSVGPVFIWYPILSNLQKKGVSYGFIATFIYNRAIKLAFLPAFIYYFDWKYVLVLTVVLIIFSVIQGLIFDNIKFPNKISNS